MDEELEFVLELFFLKIERQVSLVLRTSVGMEGKENVSYELVSFRTIEMEVLSEDLNGLRFKVVMRDPGSEMTEDLITSRRIHQREEIGTLECLIRILSSITPNI